MRKKLERLLAAKGYDVVLAASGREAVYECVVRRPDLALLDLKLPIFDGWQAFRIISAFHPCLPVILMTSEPDRYARAVRGYIDALLKEPLEHPRLLRTIRQLLARSEQEPLAGAPRRLRDRIAKSHRACLVPDRDASDTGSKLFLAKDRSNAESKAYDA